MTCMYWMLVSVLVFVGMEDDGWVDSWTWRCVDANYTPAARYGHTAVTWEDCFMMFGGGDEGGLRDDLCLFDVRSGQWHDSA